MGVRESGAQPREHLRVRKRVGSPRRAAGLQPRSGMRELATVASVTPFAAQAEHRP
jgi:hypothetical protein